MAVGQNQWYHFGVGAPPVLDYFTGHWDVDWGYGVLTHGHMPRPNPIIFSGRKEIPESPVAHRSIHPRLEVKSSMSWTSTAAAS